jgi:hypothetical protein
VSGIAIYMEGGGNTAATKQALRQGMEVFLTPLKGFARDQEWHWKLVVCGPRNEAFKRFRDACKAGDMTIVALLVDAETAVKGSSRAHLKKRDKWNLSFTSDDLVHLMVQTMEAWIVADPDALEMYYGQKFNRNVLPPAPNLEKVAKSDVAAALDNATKNTKTKGKYQKIKHASDLLKLIRPIKVQDRCPSCKRLFTTLTQAIQGA